MHSNVNECAFKAIFYMVADDSSEFGEAELEFFNKLFVIAVSGYHHGIIECHLGFVFLNVRCLPGIMIMYL